MNENNVIMCSVDYNILRNIFAVEIKVKKKHLFEIDLV